MPRKWAIKEKGKYRNPQLISRNYILQDCRILTFLAYNFQGWEGNPPDILVAQYAITVAYFDIIVDAVERS